MSNEKSPGRYTVFSRYYTSSTARRLFSFLAILLLLDDMITLILYLPSKPRFSIIFASVYQLNTSTTPTNFLSTSMQFVVMAHNPSDRSSIIYDHLSAYMAYKNELIMPSLVMPQLFQGKGSMMGMLPVLGGGFVSVSPQEMEGLKSDREYVVVGLRFVLLGRVKYRTSVFHRGWVGLKVRCDMLLGLSMKAVGHVLLLGEPKCDVDA